MRLLSTILLALAGTVFGKYFAKIGHSDNSCKHAVSAVYYLTDVCSLDGAQYSKIVCSGTTAEKQIFTTNDCSGSAESVIQLASSGDFGGCELDDGVYYSVACGDYSDSAIRASLKDEAVFVYEYAQSSGAENKCKTDGQLATAVKGYTINHCFNDAGNYIYKCSSLSFTKTTFSDAECDSAGDIAGSAQAQMTTCASSADVPVAGADAGAWVSVACQAKDFFIPQEEKGDDDNWVTDSSTGQGLVAASVLLGVLCVVLAVGIWKYGDKLNKSPKRMGDDRGL